MSAVSSDTISTTALSDADVGAWDFIKDVAGNRPYYIFEIPKFAMDTTIKVCGIVDGALVRTCSGFIKVINADNLIELFQGVIQIPGKCFSLSEKTVGYWNNSEKSAAVFKEVRKLIAQVGSTIGSYVESCEALQGLNIPVDRIRLFSEKNPGDIPGTRDAFVGSLGSSVGAASRIFDYAVGDLTIKGKNDLSPSQEKIRRPIQDSKNDWDLARDVSIFALNILSLACGGFGNVHLVPSVALLGSILGARLVSYYREVQLKGIDSNHPKMIAAKQVVKG